jgi:uncharacterized protein
MPALERAPHPTAEALATEQERKRQAWIAVAMAFGVTVLAALASHFVPSNYVATVIGLLFLGVTRVFVWQHSDEVVIAHGLGLGGAVIPDSSFRHMLAAFVRACAWAFATALLVFGFYAIGFYVYFFKIRGIAPRADLAMPTIAIVKAAGSDFAGQLLMVALPEEAFYRGYLQSKLERAFGSLGRARGLPMLAIVLTSAIFALGHLATIPNLARLAVFFPSLLFGVLRSRTRGIGAGVVFHALCNVFSTALGHAFGLY